MPFGISLEIGFFFILGPKNEFFEVFKKSNRSGSVQIGVRKIRRGKLTAEKLTTGKFAARKIRR